MMPGGSVFRLGSASVISVLMNPGAMALQVIPRLASSFATALVIPMIPALDAA